MSPAGSYKLSSVNGLDLPAVWRQVETSNGDLVQSVWVDGKMTFSEDGDYHLSLESALCVSGRPDPLGPVSTRGRWLRAGDGSIELHSDQGARGKWQASQDLTVLVAKSRQSDARTIFVFVKD